MAIEVPTGWRKIDPRNYKKLGIASNDKVICLGSYLSNSEEKPTLINFYDYSKNDESFLETLNDYYDEVEEMNELIDGDPNDEDYESTAITRSLFHGYIEGEKNLLYLNINKVLVQKGYEYMLQLFNKGNNGMFCLEMNLHNVDENNVVSGMRKSNTVNQAIEVLANLAN